MNAFKNSFQQMLYYPSALVGMLVVFLLVFTAMYAMIKIPYQEAIRLWRGGEDVWYQNPKFAPPAWINYFSSKKYAELFAVRTSDGTMVKEVTPGAEGTATTSASYTFDFTYDYYPQDMILYFTSAYQQKQPFVSVEWLTPDDRKIRITNQAITQKQTYRFSQDEKLKTRLRTEDVIQQMFSDPETGKLIKGQYQLLITGTTFEPEFNGRCPIRPAWPGLRPGRDRPGAPRFDRAVVMGRAGGPGIWTYRVPRHVRPDDGDRCRGNMVWRLD